MDKSLWSFRDEDLLVSSDHIDYAYLLSLGFWLVSMYFLSRSCLWRSSGPLCHNGSEGVSDLVALQVKVIFDGI